MSTKQHNSLVTTDLHVPGYLQSVDPGAIGAGKYWIDTTVVGGWVLKIRNLTNTGWEGLAELSNIPDTALSQIVTAGKVSGSALTDLDLIPLSAGSIPMANLGDIKLAANTTVAITAGLTSAQIQALIDAQPKDLNGFSLSFQFADGAYTLTSALTFTGFYGGVLNVQGNMVENYNNRHTTQAVALNASASEINGIVFSYCGCSAIYVYNIKMSVKTTVQNNIGIYSLANTGNVFVLGCYILGTGIGFGWGIASQTSNMVVKNNYVSTIQIGVLSYMNSSIYSEINSSTGTSPSYGLYCAYSTLRKNGVQPLGSTSSEYNIGGTIT